MGGRTKRMSEKGIENINIKKLELFGKIISSLIQGNRIKVHSCFNLTVPEKWGFKDRKNADFHIIFIKGGEGHYDLEEERVPFEKGKIIFVSQGKLHSAIQNAEKPPQIIPVRFGIYDRNENKLLNISDHPFYIAYIPKEVGEFHMLFQKLHRFYLQANSEHMELLCSSVLTEIMSRMYDDFLRFNKGITTDYRIEKARLFIVQNPLSRLTVEELASMSGLTEKYFRRLFKQQTGYTPKEYQIRSRIEYARFLLEDVKESIKSVSIATGYPDPYTFSKQFKMVMGFSPSTLLKRKS